MHMLTVFKLMFVSMTCFEKQTITQLWERSVGCYTGAHEEL